MSNGLPYTYLLPRARKLNTLLVWQWQIVEIIRVTTDAGLIGYGETLPHYTWCHVPHTAIAHVKGKNPADLHHSLTT